MGNVKKILVVDDEEALCDGLGFNLEAEGYAVDCAYSAEEALALNLGGYDLVLLDIMMGEISGIQLARIMKSNPATASVPIIFCTAKDTEEDMIAGLDLGADDYIMKPYSLKAVLVRVRTVLRRTAAPVASSKSHSDLVSYKGLVLSAKNRTCMVDGLSLIHIYGIVDQIVEYRLKQRRVSGYDYISCNAVLYGDILCTGNYPTIFDHLIYYTCKIYRFFHDG